MPPSRDDKTQPGSVARLERFSAVDSAAEFFHRGARTLRPVLQICALRRPDACSGESEREALRRLYAAIYRILRQPFEERIVTIWFPARSGSQNSSPFRLALTW